MGPPINALSKWVIWAKAQYPSGLGKNTHCQTHTIMPLMVMFSQGRNLHEKYVDLNDYGDANYRGEREG
jgi:hypothetical protein